MQQESFDDLYLKLGHAMANWANVELYIMFAMRSAMSDAETIWPTLKSFDAKLDVFGAHMRASKTDAAIQADFQLLLQHTKKLAKTRNKIVHATPLMKPVRRPDGSQVLKCFIKPFLDYSDPAKGIMSPEDIEDAGKQFGNLAIAWVNFGNSIDPENTLQSYPQSQANLILELREQRDRNRKEQQERQAELALVKHLKRHGKWPPGNI